MVLRFRSCGKPLNCTNGKAAFLSCHQGNLELVSLIYLAKGQKISLRFKGTQHLLPQTSTRLYYIGSLTVTEGKVQLQDLIRKN